MNNGEDAELHAPSISRHAAVVLLRSLGTNFFHAFSVSLFRDPDL
jgi:hypothetical protein